MAGYNIPQRQLVSHSERSIVERPDVPRSRFMTSWTRKQTMNSSNVTPFMWEECLPGDLLKWDVTAFIRMNTPLFPMLSNVKADIFFFYIPNRIVWNDWERFMGEQLTPAESIDVIHPQWELTPSDLAVGTVADYLGVPTAPQITANIAVNALPFRAYQLTWNEWFRDQNIQNGLSVGLSSGVTTGIGVFNPLPRAKFHDYFTTALPWTQKFTAPTVPIAGEAPVQGIGVTGTGTLSTQSVTETNTRAAGAAVDYGRWWQTNAAGIFVEGNPGASGVPWVFADLSLSTGLSVNSLRQAIQIQRLLERDARGGTRYAELVLSHFGVRTEDYRLNRPEYIGGGSGMVTITPVAQTAPVSGTGVGNLGAAGSGVIRAQASYASSEHGIVLGLISLRPEQIYWQGVRRAFTRTTRFDYYWPSLSQLGEQAVLRRELFATGVTANDTITFGFQERHAEYRQRYSELAAQMRVGVTNSLAAWHLAENFSTAPVLGPTFIVADQLAYDRVLAAGSLSRTANQQFWTDILIEGDYTRPLPMFGTPVGMGRF